MRRIHGATVETLDAVKNDRRRQWVSMCLETGGVCISLRKGTADAQLAALDRWCRGRHVMEHDRARVRATPGKERR